MSVHDLVTRLPAPSQLQRQSLSMAMLDALLCDEEPHRYFRFDPRWSDDEQLASMDNGSGDAYSIVFSPRGTFVRGFDHESDLSPFTRQPVSLHPGVLDGLPAELAPQTAEPAFMLDGVLLASTACWWAEPGPWRCGPARDDGATDGSRWLFDLLLDPRPESYAAWAGDYYGATVDLDVVRAAYALAPIDLELARRLRPTLTPERLELEQTSIGYPR